MIELESGITKHTNYQDFKNFHRWQSKHKKPVIVTEYGGDTMVGLHTVSRF